MGKGYRKAKKQASGGVTHRGPCFKDGCRNNGGTIHTCITCEKLAVETVATMGVDPVDAPAVFQIQCCVDHREEGLKKVKRHALVAHPANMLRVIAAGLKGEGI